MEKGTSTEYVGTMLGASEEDVKCLLWFCNFICKLVNSLAHILIRL